MAKFSWGATLRTALRIFGYLVAFGFIGFMFTPALMGTSAAVRMPVIGLLIVGAFALIFMDGSYRGEKDSAMSETLAKLEKKGEYQATAAENGKRYSLMKGILAAALAALPIFLIALYVALTAKPFVYELQDLPPWLSAYASRPEIFDALRYMQNLESTATLTDYLRVATRFMLFPFVGFFGVMTDAQSLRFDRIGPALALILPAAAAIGYLFGPRRRAKNVAEVEKAKNTPRKRLKKDRRQAAPKEKKQLV